MTVILAATCAHCGGRLARADDLWGERVVCISCGREPDADEGA